ncbi:MAG TPA: acyl-CoA dehydrogenase [Myxococcota bacterium]|nr:acyl-CoA dehydrogenase [Myxococcota bacterium]
MSTQSYTADIADIQFVLFEQLRIHETLHDTFPDYDRDTLDAVIDQAREIAEGVLSPINRPGDAAGASFDGEGNVRVPAGFKEAWDTLASGGWIGVSAPLEAGGSGMPHTVHAVTNELFFGAASAFMMYPGLTAAGANMMLRYGPEATRAMVTQKMLSGVWSGTMCLTEAGAGSDVGANRARALRTDEPGVYLLEGEKIFISGGDQDMTENIIHIILARTPDAPAGTKGLSLFMVPKFLFDADGNLGARNGAWVGNIEHKMGINGSATCTVLLGDRGPCRAWLIGKEGEGMALMFHMMNEARLGVAIQSLGIAANAYNNALSYASERKQGSTLEQMRDANAPRAAIIQHPDVRRMLLWQKCQIEAMRSLAYKLGFWADRIAAGSEDEGAALTERIDLLTPVAKAHCSDVAFECAVQALQVFGGYGFIREYPVEQHVRDAKICSIYEGTNGIQAMDLLGRKMRMRGGGVFMDWMAYAASICASGREAGFEAEAGAIDKAIQQTGATAMFLGGLGMQGKLTTAMLHATPFLRQMGTVALALESLDQAVTAKRLLDAGEGSDTARGKLLNLRFYVHNILPQATAIGKGIQSDDGAALDDALFA